MGCNKFRALLVQDAVSYFKLSDFRILFISRLSLLNLSDDLADANQNIKITKLLYH